MIISRRPSRNSIVFDQKFFHICCGNLLERVSLATTVDNCISPCLIHSSDLEHEHGMFSYQDSTFTVQRSKQGTGRVVVWKEMKLDHSYTLESSFCGYVVVVVV